MIKFGNWQQTIHTRTIGLSKGRGLQKERILDIVFESANRPIGCSGDDNAVVHDGALEVHFAVGHLDHVDLDAVLGKPVQNMTFSGSGGGGVHEAADLELLLGRQEAEGVDQIGMA
ncbi:MAG TPA: hypothetical protein PK572_02790 [Kiritimatiellia bacterium]|nr:hypothetical protein [Kiritimatiellia bacterium]